MNENKSLEEMTKKEIDKWLKKFREEFAKTPKVYFHEIDEFFREQREAEEKQKDYSIMIPY